MTMQYVSHFSVPGCMESTDWNIRSMMRDRLGSALSSGAGLNTARILCNYSMSSAVWNTELCVGEGGCVCGWGRGAGVGGGSETRMTAIVLKQDPNSQKERLFNVIIQNVPIFGESPFFEATKQVLKKKKKR